MKNIELFNVAPRVPEALQFLETLSSNLWWSWNPEAIALFRRIDADLWNQAQHNPLRFFCSLPPERLDAMCEDEGFLTHMAEVRQRFEQEVVRGSEEHLRAAMRGVAYFSLEFGIHESIRLYSGGLGCLAGDHLKSASDLNIPLVAVGLMYRQGYFQQYLDESGLQREMYPEINLHHIPAVKVCDADHRPIVIAIPLPEGRLQAEVWRLDVGRTALFLLDANIPANPPEWRAITDQLYGGDRTMRIRQEMLLGVGGVRALRAMGYDPRVYHMNEGHAAFLALARMAHLVQDEGLDGDTAFEVMTRTNVFTTHTPVPAGNETFPVDALRPYLQAMERETGVRPDSVIHWGQAPGADPGSEVSMTILGLRFAHSCNAVSRLHGEVARRMWAHLWPERPTEENPITHITNGVHVSSWLSADLIRLFDRYLGATWRDNPGDKKVLARIDKIPDEEIWRAHETGRSRLIRAAREYAERQFAARNATRAELDGVKGIFDHDALTIGFARRFASYKRATLLLRDPDRLTALLTDKERPVQIVFAGKAHPADNEGKRLIQQLVSYSRDVRVRHKVLFLENYDIQIARYMVQGVDIWLNNPRRPQEASGTSGMKAAVNGGLHCSILDGWWAEGYAPETGWAIGSGEEYENADYQDGVESQALFNLLENEIAPAFYERTQSKLPLHWVGMMKASIRMALGFFSTHRMLEEYDGRFYQPALARYDELMGEQAAPARRLVEQRRRLASLWSGVRLRMPQPSRDLTALHTGDTFDVTVEAHLGQIHPDEVEVQVYHGPVDSRNEIHDSEAEQMQLAEDRGGGHCLFRHTVACRRPGRYGLTARVVPRGGDWHAVIPGFITWANGG
jgi:starch phosphorylase